MTTPNTRARSNPRDLLAEAFNAQVATIADIVREQHPTATALGVFNATQMGDDAPVWEPGAITLDDGTEVDLDAGDELYPELTGELTSLVDMFDGWYRATHARSMFDDADELELPVNTDATIDADADGVAERFDDYRQALERNIVRQLTDVVREADLADVPVDEVAGFKLTVDVDIDGRFAMVSGIVMNDGTELWDGDVEQWDELHDRFQDAPLDEWANAMSGSNRDGDRTAVLRRTDVTPKAEAASRSVDEQFRDGAAAKLAEVRDSIFADLDTALGTPAEEVVTLHVTTATSDGDNTGEFVSAVLNDGWNVDATDPLMGQLNEARDRTDLEEWVLLCDAMGWDKTLHRPSPQVDTSERMDQTIRDEPEQFGAGFAVTLLTEDPHGHGASRALKALYEGCGNDVNAAMRLVMNEAASRNLPSALTVMRAYKAMLTWDMSFDALALVMNVDPADAASTVQEELHTIFADTAREQFTDVTELVFAGEWGGVEQPDGSVQERPIVCIRHDDGSIDDTAVEDVLHDTPEFRLYQQRFGRQLYEHADIVVTVREQDSAAGWTLPAKRRKRAAEAIAAATGVSARVVYTFIDTGEAGDKLDDATQKQVAKLLNDAASDDPAGDEAVIWLLDNAHKLWGVRYAGTVTVRNDGHEWTVPGGWKPDWSRLTGPDGVTVDVGISPHCPDPVRVAAAIAREVVTCERCAGRWGEDVTCVRCVAEDGTPRDRTAPGPLPDSE